MSEVETVNHPPHYNGHPSGVECIEIAEYMGFNIGNAFKYLWRGGLKKTTSAVEDYRKALWYLRRADEQRAPWPQVSGPAFREIMEARRQIFNRPSSWCESVRYALAAICDLCANPDVREVFAPDPASDLLRRDGTSGRAMLGKGIGSIMALAIFRHADGGHYVKAGTDPLQIKMDDGRWEPGVLYRRVHRGPTGQWQFEGANHYATTNERWADRFEDTGETTARAL